MYLKLLSYLKKAFINPEKSPSDNRILVRLLMKPIIFDLYSIFIQIGDLKTVKDLSSPNKRNKTEADVSIRHNLLELKSKVITTSRRVEKAYQIATLPWRDVSSEKLLIIGCRNIIELKQASFFGFKWKNIHGADLFSTNKKIIRTNMENMHQIKDKTFDIVTLVNTLAYSTKPDLVFSEINRILKPRGKLIFNHSFYVKGKAIKSSYSGEMLPDLCHITTAKLDMILKKNNFEIYFRMSEELKTSANDLIIKPTWYGLTKKN